MGEPVVRLENDRLRFALAHDASAAVIDLACGVEWRMGPVALQERRGADDGYFWVRNERFHSEAYAGRFRVEAAGPAQKGPAPPARPASPVLRVTLLEEFVGGRGAFTARYSLDGEWLVVDIVDIDPRISSLTYPTPFAADSLVVPRDQGELITDRETRHFLHKLIARGPTGWGLNMRWFGGLIDDERNAAHPVTVGPVRTGDPRSRLGWMAIIEEGGEYAHLIHRHTTASPIWIPSLGTWEYARRIRYRFVDGGYAEMASIFREWARGHGRWASLEEKIRERPRLGNLIGGRNVAFMMAMPFRRDAYEDQWRELPVDACDRPSGLEVQHTFAQARAITEECRQLGMKRGQFKFDGWSAGGYDARHPDIWPPEPSLGSLDELGALLAHDGPFVSCLHDNYNDTYAGAPSFPDGVARTRDGSPLPGGRWAGGLAYRTNSRDALRFALRNRPHHDELAAGGVYFDTLPAWPEESFEPGNECSREEAVRYRQELIRAYQKHGFIVGGEEGGDWASPLLDWNPVGAHKHRRGATPPLWSLVYHDCAVGIRSIGAPGPDGEFSQAMRRRCLENMLWGWAVTFRGFTAATWPTWKRAFAASLHVDEWHGRIGSATMTNHVYLTDDFTVERTEWSSGEAITVNFGEEAVEVDGRVIEGAGYAIST